MAKSKKYKSRKARRGLRGVSVSRSRGMLAQLGGIEGIAGIIGGAAAAHAVTGYVLPKLPVPDALKTGYGRAAVPAIVAIAGLFVAPKSAIVRAISQGMLAYAGVSIVHQAVTKSELPGLSGIGEAWYAPPLPAAPSGMLNGIESMAPAPAPAMNAVLRGTDTANGE